MKEISSLIQNTSLTKTQKIIANFVLSSLSDASFMTSTEIALTLGVSESSVVRFSRALGFGGFIEFQKSLRQEYQNTVLSISSSVTVPAQRVSKSARLESSAESIRRHYKNVTQNLEAALERNSAARFSEAARILSSSKRKYIAASRGNTCLANYALLYLKHMLPHVENTASTSITPFDHMCSMTKDDCLLIFSFPRYSALDKITLELALESEARIILITDSEDAQLAPHASVVLTAPINSNLFFNSFVGAQFVLEALLDVVSRNAKGVEKRLKKIDRYLEQIGTY